MLSCHFWWRNTEEDVYLGSHGKYSFMVLFISVPMENIHFGSALWSLSFFKSSDMILVQEYK